MQYHTPHTLRPCGGVEGDTHAHTLTHTHTHTHTRQGRRHLHPTQQHSQHSSVEGYTEYTVHTCTRRLAHTHRAHTHTKHTHRAESCAGCACVSAGEPTAPLCSCGLLCVCALCACMPCVCSVRVCSCVPLCDVTSGTAWLFTTAMAG
jgi:hypothetical protein